MHLLAALALAVDGQVTLPLGEWEAMLDASGRSGQPRTAPVAWLQTERTLEGGIRRGVFSGVVTSRLRVLTPSASLRIPVLDGAASIASVTLDGRPTSLLAEGGSYTVAVDSAGDHLVRVEFFVGRDDTRFARRLDLALPPGGPTALSVFIPEADIDATLAGGAITALRAESGGTRILGQLDGRGRLGLGWLSRALADSGPVRLEARENVLYTLHESLVKGVAAMDIAVQEGETDRLRFRVPKGVEIVKVTGEAVLQWRTDGDRLEVLLRWLESERAAVQVLFQVPVEDGQPVALAMPLPEEGVPVTGSVGVQAPAGFAAEVTRADNATRVQDLPPELAELTPNPLLLGFETYGEPGIVLTVARQPALALTATAIDELEASTVLIEDGAEITRMQLHVRNQTQQYLALHLPEGAALSYARIDGVGVRPAEGPDGAILLPLIQSEGTTDTGGFDWTVREGETLGDLSDRFYGDPSLYRRIVDANPEFGYGGDVINVGQSIHIPAVEGRSTVRRFVIDVGWTRQEPEMGWVGLRDLSLPALDAEVGAVEWLVFLPDAFEPLHFSGNLAAYSHIRYDHFRRAGQFLERALGVRSAWSGEAYSSILSRRKAIYAQESSVERNTEEVSGTFPLVGRSYRFKRLLPGEEGAGLSVLWVTRDVMPVARAGGLAGSAALTGTWLRGRGRLRRVAVLAGFGGLLFVAFFAYGVHRSLVWGADLALLVYLARAGWSEWRTRFPDGPPPFGEWLDHWTLGFVGRAALAVVVVFALLFVPLLWSTILLAALLWRLRRSA